MEGIVAKRTLKKSYYNNKSVNSIGLEGILFNNAKEKKKKEKSKFETYKSKALCKISIQAITMISILVFVLVIKYVNVGIVVEADITKKIIDYYNKSYSIQDIKSGVKNIAKSTYIFIKPIVPGEVEKKAQELYKVIINKENTKQKNNEPKDNLQINSEVNIYEESSVNNKENKTKENIGISVNETEIEEKIVAVSSSVSSEFNIVENIKATNIKFIKPVSGTITSHFGAREVIFEGVDSYHTGTDIAANTGTKVVSSIQGKVTRAAYNKYNGNFVEVTNGDISTIYCHMSKLSVKVGEKVKAGTKIGEVGSTGLSTGPHLHFEIVYDGTKVDPELVLDL